MESTFHIVKTVKEFLHLAEAAPLEVVADVENKGQERRFDALLGVALYWLDAPAPIYVAFHVWNPVLGVLESVAEPELRAVVGKWLAARKFIGQNIEHDRSWIDASFEIKSEWSVDTRFMWYLSDWIQRVRGYGLKLAQKILLGWKETNEKELEEVVQRLGGKLKNGDHYLAPLYLLAKYACLDVRATLELYLNRKPFFDKYDYWEYLRWITEYYRFVNKSTIEGVLVDRKALEDAREIFIRNIKTAEDDILRVCKKEIEDIEADWAIKDFKSYKSERGRRAFLADDSKRRRFNPNSSHQKALLFHEKIGLPVVKTTKTGRPSTSKKTIHNYSHPAITPFLELSENEKLRTMAESYIAHERNGKLHFPYDGCATIHTRLGGFAPYSLNMPFDCKALMSAFRLPEGQEGVHADLKAIEPCLMAEFSQDPTLLKVFRDGLGDVYLDLALSLKDFWTPELRQILLDTYDPNVPCTEEVKEKNKKVRKICKIGKLAMDYTGTEHTISENLTAAGFPTTVEDAIYIVNRHDELFVRVKALEDKLKRIHRRDGFLRSMWGGIIHVPDEFEKDMLNRFISRSAHETLIAWNFGINRLCEERDIPAWADLPDLHDATNRRTYRECTQRLVQVFKDALQDVNRVLNLSVAIQADIKTFHTLYGLKNRE